MEQLVIPKKFYSDTFNRVETFLKYGGIEHEITRFVISTDVINMLQGKNIPTRTPLIDSSIGFTSPQELRDSAYFWGGFFPENLKKTQLTQRDFARTLSIAYSHMTELYEPVRDKTNTILDALHQTYQSLDDKQRERINTLLH
ncbi:MAG: hypothetical protein LAT82_04525 [Nanoarchaeota archaeon]|nr:hypothetical protein [Nanoarchaeota archaeon]